MEIGIIYAIWSGVGTALIAIIGIIVFNESTSFLKIVGLILIIVGVISLNYDMNKSNTV
jgi:small multidrug resistance pump